MPPFLNNHGKTMAGMHCTITVFWVTANPSLKLSYSRYRDRINSVLLRSYYKRGGG